MRNNIAIFLIVLLVMTSLVSFISAEPSGKLNVFTDLSDAEIYIDGQLLGKESVVGYTLPVGTHFVKVVYQGKTVYAKTAEVLEGRTNTVTSDNFVNIKTSTPSRGAVEVEAARLREYRGNAGFGYFGPSPTTGLSFKWWFSRDFGLQTIGFAQTEGDLFDNSFGVRFLYGFPKKIFSEEVLDAYMALGFARSWHQDKGAPINNSNSESMGIYFGAEANIGRLANAIFLTKTYIADDVEDSMALIGQVLSLGLLNICYSSLEIGIEQQTVYKGGTAEMAANMKINYGLHYFF